MVAFHIRAVNTAVESENRIHDNSVAAGYGFRGGLVPGVTVYGYMAAAAMDVLGPDWLTRGAMGVRFFEPFYDGEDVKITVEKRSGGKIKVDAGSRASATAWIDDAVPSNDYPDDHAIPKRVPSHETIRPGMTLASLEKTLDLSQPGVSAPLEPFIRAERFAHPAIILGLVNELLMHNYELGPWIHSSSEVRNASPARDGEHLQVRGKIVDAFEKKGHELLMLDAAILGGDRLVSRIRHTAIWKPRKI